MNTILETILINGEDNPLVKDLTLSIEVGDVPKTANVTVYPYPKAPKGHTHRNLAIIHGILNIPVNLIFVSYAREDEDKVIPITERLMDEGYICWLDQKQILAGDRWKPKIEAAIRHTRYAIVFLSRKSTKKIGYVQREWKLLRERADLYPTSDRYLIPVLLEECHVPEEFQEFSWADMRKPEGYNNLLRALR